MYGRHEHVPYVTMIDYCRVRNISIEGTFHLKGGPYGLENFVGMALRHALSRTADIGKHDDFNVMTVR